MLRSRPTVSIGTAQQPSQALTLMPAALPPRCLGEVGTMFADDVSLAGTIRLMGPQNCGAIASGSTDIAVELYRLASRSEAGGCGTQNGRIGDRPGTVMGGKRFSQRVDFHSTM